MALFKKLISAVKKFLKGKPRRRKSKKNPVRRSRRRTTVRLGRKVLSLRKKQKKIKKKKVRPVKKPRSKPKSRPFLKPKVPAKKPSVGKQAVKKPAEPARPQGVLTGEVTHYFSKIMVVVVKMTHGTLMVGNNIRIKGNTNDFAQKVSSLQIESEDVKVAPKGQLVGLKVIKPAKPGDKVFKLP